MSIRPPENGPGRESSIAGPSRLSPQITKQTGSPVIIEKRVPTSSKGATVASTSVFVYGGTALSPGRAVETAEIYEGSDEWGMGDPEDWVAILMEMRNNIQDLAGSLLGQGQLSRRDGRVTTSHASNPSGSKVYPTAYYSHSFSGLMRSGVRELIRQAATILRSSYDGWRIIC